MWPHSSFPLKSLLAFYINQLISLPGVALLYPVGALRLYLDVGAGFS